MGRSERERITELERELELVTSKWPGRSKALQWQRELTASQKEAHEAAAERDAAHEERHAVLERLENDQAEAAALREALELWRGVYDGSGAIIKATDAALATDAGKALLEERDALKKFKAFVHDWLDRAGVPADPPGKHRDEGCRVGQRLKWMAERLEKAERERDENWRQFQTAFDHCATVNTEREVLRERLATQDAEIERCRAAIASVRDESGTWVDHVEALAERLATAERERDDAEKNAGSPRGSASKPGGSR